MLKPKSKYLRELIKKTRFKDKETIEHLTFLEYSIKRGERTREFEFYYNLPSHQEHIINIAKELNPKFYAVLKREENRETREDKESFERDKKANQKEKRAWLKHGGKN